MKEIAPLLEKLAQQLGTTVDYLWRVLIKQAFISSVMDLIQYIILILGSIVLWKVFKKVYQKSKAEGWDVEWIMIPILCGVFIAILWVVMFFCIPYTITGFINPKYWALEKVLKLINK